MTTSDRQIKIFPNADQLAHAFAEDFYQWSERCLKQNSPLTVALSGGSTPRRLFEIWGRATSPNQPDWSQLHFFWGDERCVPPADSESNYGIANELWLSKLGLDPGKVHRVQGEAEPNEEQIRYAQEVLRHTRPGPSNSTAQPLPQFDLVILGMGSDGHVASIFPDRMDLFDTPDICAVATHPQSGQRRITFTGPVILQARRIVFLITGADKAEVLNQVLKRTGNYQRYPAAQIIGPQVEYFLDESAAAELAKQ